MSDRVRGLVEYGEEKLDVVAHYDELTAACMFKRTPFTRFVPHKDWPPIHNQVVHAQMDYKRFVDRVLASWEPKKPTLRDLVRSRHKKESSW